MIIDPYAPLPILPGTRLLTDYLGLQGILIEDPKERGRSWTITTVLAPLRTRQLGGIRVKLVDNKGFISFLNQRDLELLLDLAKPGQWCTWNNSIYPGINDEVDGWYGICCDTDDLLDDLHEYELILRQHYQQYNYIPSGVEYRRRVHRDSGKDYDELLTFLWDKDPDTNYGPDGRLETLERRWRSVEKVMVTWPRLL